MFRNIIIFYGEELLAPRPTPKLEVHPLSAVRDCLFNIFAATSITGGRSSIRNLRTRHAVVTGTHLTRHTIGCVSQKQQKVKIRTEKNNYFPLHSLFMTDSALSPFRFKLILNFE
jgi:hypothetical protein